MLQTRSYQRMRRLYEAACKDKDSTIGSNQFLEDFRESMVNGHYDPFQFSIRELFEHLVPDGREIMASWNPRTRVNSGVVLTEAGGAVTTGMFANVFGQITYSTVLKRFENPVFLWPQLSRNVPTPYEFERVPGVSNLGDVTEDIAEGAPYPTAGVSEEWIDTRPTVKHGVIVPVTKEAAFFDRTGQVLSQAMKVADALAIDKEKRIVAMAVGNTDAYRRNGKAAVQTYNDNTGDHDWDNLAASNGLTNYTDVENAMLLLEAITDPDTGEPVLVNVETMKLLVPPALRMTARNILNATEIRFGDITAGAGLQTVGSRNPITLGDGSVLSNQYVKDATSSDTTWFFGDWMEAITYRENWPISTPPIPPNSHDEIHNDIMHQFKVTERGEVQMEQPRVLVKSTG